MGFEFERFSKRGARLVKTPEVTIQAKGIFSLNAAAYHLIGEIEAVELLYDKTSNVIGLKPIDATDEHAYPVRPVGGKKAGKSASQFLVAGTAFMNFFELPYGQPVRREVKFADGVLIIDLNEAGRTAVSNRNAKRKSTSERPEEPDGSGASAHEPLRTAP
ncbi:hypothetical protein BH24ACT4_BH24ACT4_10920 [soil metagenome]